jgi:NADH-quinone oxidoreductase subunit E
MVFELTESMCAVIDKELAHYPHEKRQSAVIGALMAVQREHGGHLSEAIIEKVADYIDIPRVAAFEVATFYSMFNLTPCGRYQLSVCSNISCMLNGADEIISTIKSELGVGEGEVTDDGLFSLKPVSCLGHCDDAPMLQVNDQRCEMRLTPDRVKALLEDLRAEVGRD